MTMASKLFFAALCSAAAAVDVQDLYRQRMLHGVNGYVAPHMHPDDIPELELPNLEMSREALALQDAEVLPDYMNWCGHHKVAALTFDDGPRPEKVSMVLDTLRERGVKATFLITVGIYMPNPVNDRIMCNYARQILDEGHSLQHHSWSHGVFANMNSSTMEWELNKLKSWYHDCLCREKNDMRKKNKPCKRGEVPTLTDQACLDPKLMKIDEKLQMTIFRPPQGAIGTWAKVSEINGHGYTVANWNVDTNDWRGGNTEDIWGRFASAVTRVPEGGSAVVLMHDWAFPEDSLKVERNVVHRIIDYFEEREYSFVTMQECHKLCYNATDRFGCFMR
eukprot:TRINITY_DN30503_c0_g2_i1.p1 TRINITY_DN30503_c0_g2~~TRINITY_DN30503_c0_g2_i1.p1  ORF type:complete len:335 (+),score=156.11 TRINITY_DN30503_c0_g2_i1:125-1129(+)